MMLDGTSPETKQPQHHHYNHQVQYLKILVSFSNYSTIPQFFSTCNYYHVRPG
jgi:hypothetical protein